jgi:hypothetical protein
VSWSVKHTLRVSGFGLAAAFLAGAFLAAADEEFAAFLVALVLPVATGAAVSVTAFLRLAMMGKILGLRKMQQKG